MSKGRTAEAKPEPSTTPVSEYAVLQNPGPHSNTLCLAIPTKAGMVVAQQNPLGFTLWRQDGEGLVKITDTTPRPMPVGRPEALLRWAKAEAEKGMVSP